MKKLFKKLLITGALILSPTFVLVSCGNGNEDEPPIDNIDPNPEVKTFTITSTFDSTMGNVELSKNSGNVGESVTATITPKTGYNIKTISFNEETLQIATSLTLNPKEGANSLSVTFNKESVVEKSLVLSGNYKTEYIVGEAFSLQGLDVKLVTTTDGTPDAGVSYKDFKTNPIEVGYVFKEADITLPGDTFDVTLFSDDETITGATIELTIKQKPVVEVGITPADFLKKMKTVGKYKVESAETVGTYIPNANYWEAKKPEYSTYGFAQNGEKIIAYSIIKGQNEEVGRINELNTYKYTDKFKVEDLDGTISDHTYTGMYDDEFTKFLTNSGDIYFSRGIEFITDEEIETYRKTLKPSINNPNEFVFSIKEDANSVFARDIIQLTYNGTLALNDMGLALTIGQRSKVKMTIVDENTMKINIVNGSDVRYWPTETVITIDETLDIPEIQPFLKNEVVVDPDLERTKVAFEALRKGNFTTSLGDVYNEKYVYRKTANQAIYSSDKEFTFDGQKFERGTYRVQFNDKNVTDKANITGIEIGGYNSLANNEMLNKDGEYLPFYNEESNELILSIYPASDSSDYFNGMPTLYTNLFNIDVNSSEEDVHFSNLTFTIHFADKECKIVDCVDIKFGRQSGNKTIKLNNFGTSKVEHVETFISSLK